MIDFELLRKQVADLMYQFQIRALDMALQGNIVFADAPNMDMVHIFNTFDFFDGFFNFVQVNVFGRRIH